MILSEFAKYLKSQEPSLLNGEIAPIELLHIWLENILQFPPKANFEKIIHKEILYCKNNSKDYAIIGKSTSGRKLLKALIEYSKSYSNYTRSRWIDNADKAYYSSKNFRDKI